MRIEIAFAIKFPLAFALEIAFAWSDPILDGSICKSHMFCRRILHVADSVTQRESALDNPSFYQSINPFD